MGLDYRVRFSETAKVFLTKKYLFNFTEILSPTLVMRFSSLPWMLIRN